MSTRSPLFLQRGLGDSPLRAAVTGFAPMAAGIVLASVICMNLITRLGRTLSPAEAGSASGSLSSVQQLANALGPAIVTTIYFGALAGGQAHAMTVSLLAVIGIGAASALAVPLLPRKPQADTGH